MNTEAQPGTPDVVDAAAAWGQNAPRGARTVFSRIVKDGANVPLFLSQTLVSSMRDVGYNHTTSAVCEFVDNSIESGASEVRVYFPQSGKKGNYRIGMLVLDNGRGMSAKVLKAGMAFGGSTRYDSRVGIARYGMGMKTAALSMGPALEVLSWQEPSAYYRMELDTEAIGNEKANVVMLSEPVFADVLPPEVRDVLTVPMEFPRDPNDQDLLCGDPSRLSDSLGNSGTIVYVPDCDRLTHRKAQTLVDHATKEFARIYRRQLADGLALFVNNRPIAAFDPTYSLGTARHASVPEIQDRERHSRLVNTITVQVPATEDGATTHPVTMRLYKLPIEAWADLPRKVLRNDLKVFDGNIISYMRGRREVHSAGTANFAGKFHTYNHWWRLEVEFPGELDEAFGININKQGVRPKEYVAELLKKELREPLRHVKVAIQHFMARRAAESTKSQQTAAEKLASDAEAFQATVVPAPAPKTEEDRKALELGLRELARHVARADESEEEALKRVVASRYFTVYKHDPDAPFYRVDFRLGRVILTLNSAHPFYDQIYKVLAGISSGASSAKDIEGAESEVPSEAEFATDAARALTGLHLLFFALARTQAEMTLNDTDSQLSRAFDTLRLQWSLNLRTQLDQQS